MGRRGPRFLFPAMLRGPHVLQAENFEHAIDDPHPNQREPPQLQGVFQPTEILVAGSCQKAYSLNRAAPPEWQPFLKAVAVRNRAHLGLASACLMRSRHTSRPSTTSVSNSGGAFLRPQTATRIVIGIQAAALPVVKGWATKRTPSAAQTRLMVAKRGALSGRRAL